MARDIDSPRPPGIQQQVDTPPGLLRQPLSPHVNQTPDSTRKPFAILREKTVKAVREKMYGTSHFALLSGNAAMPVAVEVGRLLQHDVPKNPDPFSNNEWRVKIPQGHVPTKDVYAIQTTNSYPDASLSQLKLLLEGAKGDRANRTTAVLLHLPYSRQDRRAQPGEPESARQKALEIVRSGSHNPDKKWWQHETAVTAKTNLIIVEVHSTKPLDVIARDSRYQWASLDSSSVLLPKIQEIITTQNLDAAIAFPDETALTRYGKYAEILGEGIKKAAVIKKKRDLDKANTVAIREDQESLTNKVAGKDIFLIDDIADTLGTVLQAAKRLKEDGARSVRVVATHGVFSGEAKERLEDPAIDGIIVTDTIQQHFEHPKLQVVSIAPLIAEVIRRIESREPLGDLVKSQSSGFEKTYRGLSFRSYRVNKERRNEYRREKKARRNPLS